jgi:predicted PurR-regulated permease PerM
MNQAFGKFAAIERITLYRALIVTGSLLIILAGSLIVIAPFIPALLLGLIFCLATWPAFDWLTLRLHNRPTLAAALMTLLLAACFILPLVFLGSSLADNFANFTAVTVSTLQNKNSAPPAWMKDIPLIGHMTDNIWNHYLRDQEKLIEALRKYAGPITQILISFGAAIGRGVLDVTLGAFIAFFLFRHGVQAARRLRNLIDKFLGAQGQHMLAVSKLTVTGVVYGLLGTALAQGALAAIGFWIAGIPGPAFLGLVVLVLSFLPVGPPLVWIPAVLWLYSQDQVGMAIFMFVWGLLISICDNVIRPYFISRGSKLPLLVVLMGVFGGIIAFGFIGIFIGPTLLAIAYTLIMEWSLTPPREAFKEAAVTNSETPVTG